MTCAAVQTAEPCTRGEFEAIAAPIVKMALAIRNAHNKADRMRGEYNFDGSPRERDAWEGDPEGTGSYAIRDAILEHGAAFGHWWGVSEPVGFATVNYDDAKLAGMFLATHEARKDRVASNVLDLNPAVCQARSWLEAAIVQDFWHVYLDRERLVALVEAGKAAESLVMHCEDQPWLFELRAVRNRLRSLAAWKRMRAFTVRVDWREDDFPCLTFTWPTGRLRLPAKFASGSTDELVSFRCDRSVGTVRTTARASITAWGESIDTIAQIVRIHPERITADERAEFARFDGEIETAGAVPADTNGRVATTMEDWTMSESKISMQADLDTYKWNATVTRTKKGANVVLYAIGNKVPLADCKAETVNDAYEAARKAALAGKGNKSQGATADKF